jgi:uncharacterized protein YecE (DUF72 family)
VKRLKNAEEETAYLLDTIAVLGDRLGIVLFQLPPCLHLSLSLLEEFLKLIPSDVRVAFEFRHESWMQTEVYRILEQRGCALCVADTDDGPASETVSTADWSHLRLRRSRYGSEELKEWVERTRGRGWHEVFVFFTRTREPVRRWPAAFYPS